jgi:Zn-finger nucleic acid-binding protein
MELVTARGYFFCRYCGSFHFPETVGDDGIRVLGDAQAPLSCATCSQPLASAMLDESFPVHYCRNCRGLLTPRASFATVVQRRRAWALDQPGPIVPLDRSELDRKLACPVCKGRMITHPYYGPGNVVIDNCDTCDSIWLDFGELGQIVAAPGRDRGTREQIARATADTPARNLDAVAEPTIPDGVDLLALMWRLF